MYCEKVSSYSKQYHNEYNKLYHLRKKDNEDYKKRRRKNNLRYDKLYPERRTAKNLLASAIRWKGFKRGENCEICHKKGKVQGHHKDYSKPLEVIWCCIDCHTKLRRMRK